MIGKLCVGKLLGDVVYVMSKLTQSVIAGLIKSAPAGLLTPVVSLQIQKPARSRRSGPIHELKFKFRRLARPSKIISKMNLTEESDGPVDLADNDVPAISFFDGITRIHSEFTDFCFTLPQRRFASVFEIWPGQLCPKIPLTLAENSLGLTPKNEFDEK